MENRILGYLLVFLDGEWVSYIYESNWLCGKLLWGRLVV